MTARPAFAGLFYFSDRGGPRPQHAQDESDRDSPESQRFVVRALACPETLQSSPLDATGSFANSCPVADKNARHVLVLGAGFGGLTFCKHFRNPNARITLVDRTNHHLFQPLLYQVATAGISGPEIAQLIRS